MKADSDSRPPGIEQNRIAESYHEIWLDTITD